MVVDRSDFDRAKSAGAQFFKIRDLKPGQNMEVDLLSMDKNTAVSNPKYCIKDKDYNYRVRLVDDQGVTRIMDINSPAAIGEFVRALYPDGFEGGLKPCKATLTRRSERKTTQSELQVVRAGEELVV